MPGPAATKHATADEQPGFILLLVAALYFAQGLPLGLIFGAYPVILRNAGAELSFLAWIPLLGIPWILKFIWSPLIDNHWLAAIGRRKTWLLSQQALMIATMAALALAGAGQDTAVTSLVLLGFASLCAATQDIATDGLAAEQLRGRHLAYANALSVGGMAAGTMVGGGGVLMAVDTWEMQASLLALTGLLALCAIPALLWRERSAATTAHAHTASLRGAAARPAFALLLAIAGLYAIPHSADGALSRLYLVDKSWSLADIGLLDTISMTSMIVLGCGGAAWLVARFGAWRCLTGGMLLILASSLAWLALSWPLMPPDWITVAAIRLASSAGMGLASVAVFTVIMLFAGGGAQTGTDVTVFKSANVFGEVGAASLATALAGQVGYAGGFGLSLLGGLAILSLLLARPRTLDLGSTQDTKEAP